MVLPSGKRLPKTVDNHHVLLHNSLYMAMFNGYVTNFQRVSVFFWFGEIHMNHGGRVFITEICRLSWDMDQFQSLPAEQVPHWSHVEDEHIGSESIMV